MKWWQGLLVGLGVTTLALFGTCLVCMRAVEEVGKGIEETFREYPLTILTSGLGVDEFGSPLLTGTAENTNEFALSEVYVEVKWYSKEGYLLGDSSDYLSADLLPGESWQFEITGWEIDANEVSDYDVKGYGYKSSD